MPELRRVQHGVRVLSLSGESGCDTRFRQGAGYSRKVLGRSVTRVFCLLLPGEFAERFLRSCWRVLGRMRCKVR